MNHLVMPGDANGHGTAFGGVVMQWTDLAAGMSAMRHTRLPVVTAAIDQLAFLAPVRIGQQVTLVAQVNAVFATGICAPSNFTLGSAFAGFAPAFAACFLFPPPSVLAGSGTTSGASFDAEKSWCSIVVVHL